MSGFAFGSTRTGTAGDYSRKMAREEEERRRGGQWPLTMGMDPSLLNGAPIPTATALPKSGGVGGGSPGSRFGAFPGRPRIGSAAGALGSAGVPTSQRGRLAKFGPKAASMTTAAVSQAVRQDGGLSQSQNYAGMGGLPPALTPEEQAREQLMTDAASFEAVQQAPGVNYTGAPRKIDPLTGLPRYGRGTGRGIGRPIPHGQPFIAGDPQKDGRPNEELILPTSEGVHVLPLKDLPRHGEGTMTLRRPRVDRRIIPTKPAAQALRGMDKFYADNPATLTAAQAEMRKAVMHPTTPVRFPSPPLKAIRKYAKGTLADPEDPIYAMYAGEPVLPPSALSTITGQPDVMPAPQDGEMRNDAQGNAWRYDARLGRGVPVNPYLGQPNAPMPISTFTATGPERYNDLAHRLSALRQEGMARGRAAVDRVKAQQQAEEAANRLPESERVRTSLAGGGQGISGRYGTATIGRNVPKSFAVERLDGSSGRYNNLAEADVESRADAAQRYVEGVPMNTGRGVGTGVVRPGAVPVSAVEPSALAEIIGEQEILDGTEAEILAPSAEVPSAIIRPPASGLIQAPVPVSRVGRLPAAMQALQQAKAKVSNKALLDRGKKFRMSAFDWLMNPAS